MSKDHICTLTGIYMRPRRGTPALRPAQSFFRTRGFCRIKTDIFSINPKGINAGQLVFAEYDLQQYQPFLQSLARISWS